MAWAVAMETTLPLVRGMKGMSRRVLMTSSDESSSTSSPPPPHDDVWLLLLLEVVVCRCRQVNHEVSAPMVVAVCGCLIGGGCVWLFDWWWLCVVV